jgi:hypothetical protein
MSKQIFNEVELYVLKNWTDARLLEESLNRMRKKYKEVLDKVLAEVRKKHRELDHDGLILNIDEEDDDARNIITIGVSKNEWSSNDRKQPTGLWLSGIAFGPLIVEREISPCANVFIYPGKDSKLDLPEVTRKLEDAATRILPEIEFRREPEAGTACIYYSLPETQKKLLELLLKDESRGFISCLVAHFNNLAKFIPVVDKLFQKGKRNGKGSK